MSYLNHLYLHIGSTCTLCQSCVWICPENALSNPVISLSKLLQNEKEVAQKVNPLNSQLKESNPSPILKHAAPILIDHGSCTLCALCIEICPEDCIKPKEFEILSKKN